MDGSRLVHIHNVNKPALIHLLDIQGVVRSGYMTEQVTFHDPCLDAGEEQQSQHYISIQLSIIWFSRRR